MRIGAELALVALLASALPAASSAAEKQAEYAVVAGTVFREPGFALPGAEVRLTVKTQPEKGKRVKPQNAVSDGRGEFAFHVPAAKAEYVVSVQASGYESQEKPASVTADERLDVYFELKAVK